MNIQRTVTGLNIDLWRNAHGTVVRFARGYNESHFGGSQNLTEYFTVEHLTPTEALQVIEDVVESSRPGEALVPMTDRADLGGWDQLALC